MNYLKNWKNISGIDDYEDRLDEFLGFIYEITLEGDKYYVGRKQFWLKRGRNWVESDWRDYYSSSNIVKEHADSITGRSILGIFSSKSAIRYAEAAAIIWSNAYLDADRGINWSFDGCKGTLKLTESDRQQLEHIRSYYADRR